MYFVSSKHRTRTIVSMGVVVGLLSFGLLLFHGNESVVLNFRFYYLKSYSALMQSLIVPIRPREAVARDPGVAESIPVITYHGVLSKDDGTEVNVSIDQFKDQLYALKRAGFHTVTMTELHEFLQGKTRLPDRSFVLSFDDGRKDSFYPVDPILRALDYHAVIFVISKFAFLKDSNYYLSAEELRTMESSGRWEVQSHGKNAHEMYAVDEQGTLGHYMSNRLWLLEKGRHETDEEFRSRVKGDLMDAKRELEDAFGPVIAYAFPFGDFGHDSLNYPDGATAVLNAASSTYAMSLYQQPMNGYRFSSNYADQTELRSYFVRRIDVNPSWSGNDLVQVLTSARAKQLPFVATFNKEDGWIRTWGSLGFNPSKFLVMEAVEGQTGGSAILDGTRLWKDYTARVTVQDLRGTSVYLYARYTDDLNFVGCNFGEGIIHVEQTLDGTRTVAQGVKRASPNPQGNFDIGIRARGRTVECLFDSQVVVATQFLDERLTRGGVGLKIWDQRPGVSRVAVSDFRVDTNE